MAIVDKINAFLTSTPPDLPLITLEAGRIAESIFKRQFLTERKSRPGIGLSEAGKCVRQSSYKYLGFEQKGKEIDARGRVTFYMGDCCECMVYLLAKCAGCNVTNGGLEQKSISLKIGDKEIWGHPDCILDGRLVEIKSMSSFSFSDFENGEVDPGYLSQINAYMEALGFDECIMVALNKDSGVLAEKVIKKNPDIVAALVKNLTSVIGATKENLPEGAYMADKNGIYPWQCMYCAYHITCLPNAEKVVIKGRYKLKEKKIEEKKTNPVSK